VFRIKLAAVWLMVVAVVGGLLVGTAQAAGKVALLIDVGARRSVRLAGVAGRRLQNLRSLKR
jgi:hypothetical protein